MFWLFPLCRAAGWWASSWLQRTIWEIPALRNILCEQRGAFSATLSSIKSRKRWVFRRDEFKRFSREFPYIVNRSKDQFCVVYDYTSVNIAVADDNTMENVLIPKYALLSQDDYFHSRDNFHPISNDSFWFIMAWFLFMHLSFRYTETLPWEMITMIVF